MEIEDHDETSVATRTIGVVNGSPAHDQTMEIEDRGGSSAAAENQMETQENKI